MNYRFCFLCGKNLQPKSSEVFICTGCGQEHYINPKPCNAIILVNKYDEILLVKRAIDPMKGSWDLPGGFTSPGETMEESVRRELLEELNIKVENVHYLSSFVGKYKFMNVNYDTLCFIYYSTIDNIRIEAMDDVESFKFFNKKEIPFNEIAFPGITASLKEYIELKTST